jgi:hypothetical protein
MFPGLEAGDFMDLIVLSYLRAFPESFQVNAVINLNIMPLVSLSTPCNEKFLISF